MSKMGEELEKRLDENKYELYEALGIMAVFFQLEGYKREQFTVMERAKKVLAKIEGVK